jgi:hypothetical protein
MWEHGGCLESESVQQNAIARCCHLECNQCGTCEMCTRTEGTQSISFQVQQEDVQPDSVTFVWVLNECASVAALEEGVLISR